ncbi:hypothetical protein TNIN_271521 [Trichonephila inaurata madagascariensis]|uniref:Uncharacterized protein n=1 Tax=Trichonephila inaurata madagascariensis TaxID=2747483 RepID=A0A8X6J7N2_9ARAC|nr:hypothetical protein TNIN_294661 [Trichonephila inaurata madagascariensis]GFY43516.1 hypothetical protein TNIN_271521 [Trichonephila inaurata madagascariensis]
MQNPGRDREPCPEVLVSVHLAVQRERPKDKPCPEDQVLTHLEVEGESPKNKRYQEGLPHQKPRENHQRAGGDPTSDAEEKAPPQMGRGAKIYPGAI